MDVSENFQEGFCAGLATPSLCWIHEYPNPSLKLIGCNIRIPILVSGKLPGMDVGYDLIGETMLFNKLMIIRFSGRFFC
jgi:hypothetical protein